MKDGWFFGRVNDIPDVPGGLSKKELFSVYRKLCANGWLIEGSVQLYETACRRRQVGGGTMWAMQLGRDCWR